MPCQSEHVCGEGRIQYELDQLTKKLCRFCKLLRVEGKEHLLTPELRKWWKGHQEFDRKRIEANLVQRREYQKDLKAYNKLTQEERKRLSVRRPSRPYYY